MSIIEKTVKFFQSTLGQDVITLSLHANQAKVEALDEFVVRAAAKGLLVEIWIDGDRREYGFGDYVELLKRESRRVENNPYLDPLELPPAVTKEWDDGEPKG